VSGGASGEEAAWRDLIANYAAEPTADGGDVPWPERENLATPRQAGPLADAGPDTDPALMIDLSDDTDPALDLDADPALDLGREPGADPGTSADPAAGQSAGPAQLNGSPPGPAGNGGPGWGPGQPRIVRPASSAPPPAADDEDFVPPVPPPLPSLDPITKGAWVALFGGPGYLLVATMVGWQVPGWLAFLAVAAFVGGFATLVIRMGDKPPRDSGPDDGAVL